MEMEIELNSEISTTEMPEIKSSHHAHIETENLSEWELARLTSKTWSMSQD